MPRRKIEGLCSIDACNNPIDSLGLCQKHYSRLYNYGRLYNVNTGEKARSPFYGTWWDRKRSPLGIAPEWENFSNFVKDISPKPGKHYMMVKLRKEEPWGPTNFKWLPHLSRREGESKKDWYARKWASRNENFPDFDRGRQLKRQFNITIEDYDRMVAQQNNRCAICGLPEKSVEHKSGKVRRLAVDHCHKTGNIRALLCWRCNGALGRLEESIPLLHKMISYIEKYNGKEHKHGK